MAINRRDFFSLAALGSASLVTGTARASSEATNVSCDQAYGVLVDTVLCIGCRKCEWACQREHLNRNAVPTDYEDKSVFRTHRRMDDKAYTVVNQFANPKQPGKAYNIKVQCMHCNDPACASACIVGALSKNPQGPVEYDAWKCIGCRYCIVACPFQVPAYEYYNALDPQVRKCTFCADRVLHEGRRPACVEICPNESLTFGERRTLLDMAHSRIRAFPEKYYDYIYGEKEVGGTSWNNQAPASIENTELPKLPLEALPPNTETIQHAIFKWFIPPVALYGLLGLIMHSKEDEEEAQEATHEQS